jgi:hypothetical protein
MWQPESHLLADRVGSRTSRRRSAMSESSGSSERKSSGARRLQSESAMKESASLAEEAKSTGSWLNGCISNDSRNQPASSVAVIGGRGILTHVRHVDMARMDGHEFADHVASWPSGLSRTGVLPTPVDPPHWWPIRDGSDEAGDGVLPSRLLH